MQDGLYRIGEVSRITGISRDTLHFYDKIGLLTPEYVGPENRYRYYSRKNLWELDIITICRSLDLPLERIREILSLRDNGKIAGILMAYRQEALRRRDYYDRVAADIQWYHDEIGRLDGWHCPEGVRLETFPARTGSSPAPKSGAGNPTTPTSSGPPGTCCKATIPSAAGTAMSSILGVCPAGRSTRCRSI